MLALALAAAAPAEDRLPVARFSEARPGVLPEGWEPLTFERIDAHTRYRTLTEEGRTFVRAEARASASGLVRRLGVDLHEYPVLCWEWRVHGVLEKGDVASKQGDDYPARIYVTFAYEPERVGMLKRMKYLAARAMLGDLPIGAVSYIWASRAERGLVVGNVYAPDFVKMVVVESGTAELGVWKRERRDLLADYRGAFGEDPPAVNGVAIMSDADDTGEAVSADYGDIWFEAAR